MGNLVTRKLNIPAYLKPTAADAAEQERLRALAQTRARLTPEERMLSRGAALEEVARQNLNAALSTLADGMAMRGKYLEAAKVHPDKARADHFRSVHKAIKRPDKSKCRCKDAEYTVAAVYSEKHKKVVPLKGCASCGHLNARPDDAA
jgi:hypothetical protein